MSQANNEKGWPLTALCSCGRTSPPLKYRSNDLAHAHLWLELPRGCSFRFITVNLVEARKAFPISSACEVAIRDFSANKMETKMRKKILTVLVVPLITAFTVQAAAASERHHTRTKGRPVSSEQFRNSNAYAAPDYVAVPSRLQQLDEGMMASGPAGH
jgi:hypothetical protein